ncbi:tyrosine-type recombinase/integrase, partial [Nocardioides jejuensis]
MAGATKDSRKKRSDGEGSLYPKHRADCARPLDARGNPKCKCPWVGAVVLGYIDGKPVRRKVQASTRAGAAARLREKQQEFADQQLPAVGKPITVEKWMTYWLTQIAPRKVAAQTIDNSYNCKVRQYIVPLLGHHRLDRLTQEHIEAAWDHLRTKGNPTLEAATPLSDKTVLQTHRILSRALKVAVQRKRLRANPADTNSMDAPTAKDKEMDVFTVEEVRSVLAAAEGERLEARWVIALALGLRQGEALGLRWEDVDLEDNVLRVRVGLQRRKGKGLILGDLKTKGSRRDLALGDKLVRILKAHKKAQTAERLAAGSTWTDSG